MCKSGKRKNDYNSYSDDDNFQNANNRTKKKGAKYSYNNNAFDYENRNSMAFNNAP